MTALGGSRARRPPRGRRRCTLYGPSPASRAMSNPPLRSARYSDEELTAMMADLESDLVERKESLRGDTPVKIRQAVCAFANDLPDHRRPRGRLPGGAGRRPPGGGDRHRPASAPVGRHQDRREHRAAPHDDGGAARARRHPGGGCDRVAVGLAAGALPGTDLDSGRPAPRSRQRAGRTDAEREAAASGPALRRPPSALGPPRRSRSGAFPGGLSSRGRRSGDAGRQRTAARKSASRPPR